MAPKVIIRFAKIKNMSGVHNEARHNNRMKPMKNVDPTRSHLNVHFGAANKTTPDLKAAFDSRLKTLSRKKRPDANIALEYVVACPPAWAKTATREEILEYLDTGKKFLEDKFGKDNIVAGWYHFDERTPHGHFICVPIDNKQKLNANYYIGGKDKGVQLQTDFALACKHLGFERGVTSDIEHKSVSEFWKNIDKNTALSNDHIKELDARIEQVSIKEERLDALNAALEIKNKVFVRARDEYVNRLKDLGIDSSTLELAKSLKKNPKAIELFNEINENPEILDQIASLGVSTVIGDPPFPRGFNSFAVEVAIKLGLDLDSQRKDIETVNRLFEKYNVNLEVLQFYDTPESAIQTIMVDYRDRHPDDYQSPEAAACLVSVNSTQNTTSSNVYGDYLKTVFKADIK